jgi:hypothetical protein
MLKVHNGNPIIRKILRHLAGSTCALRANISSHRDIELVATNDMVKKARGFDARLNDVVKAVDSQGRVSKGKTGLHTCDKSGSDGNGDIPNNLSYVLVSHFVTLLYKNKPLVELTMIILLKYIAP